MGKYVWFVDADDFIGKNILDKVQRILQASRADVLQVGAFPFSNELSPEERIQYETGDLHPKSYANNVFVTRNIFKREFLERYQIRFYAELCYSEDKVFISEVLMNNPTIERMSSVGYYYRYHAGSAITKGNSLTIEKRLFMWKFVIARFQKAYSVAPTGQKSAIADNLMSEVYHCFYTLSGLPAPQYREVKHQLKAEGILCIKRPKECTLKKSYLVNSSGFVWKVFDFVYTHLNSALGRGVMRCIRLANQKVKKM